MTQFIYNYAYRSGGRWHIAENVKTTLVSERVREDKVTVKNYDGRVDVGKELPGVLYGEPEGQRGAYAGYGRNTPAYDGYRYPILGEVSYTLTTPEYRIVEADAACGSVRRIKISTLRHSNWTNRAFAKANIGKHLDLVAGKVVRLMFEDVDGASAPEPLCLYCAKKLERGYDG